jgi:hypothetical protein
LISALTAPELPVEIRTMIRAIIDDRLRRVWAILIGMSALAVTVVMITILIHDRVR